MNYLYHVFYVTCDQQTMATVSNVQVNERRWI